MRVIIKGGTVDNTAPTGFAEHQASLEATLKDEILRMYEEVAEQPDAEFHFFHGREAAELFGYDLELLDKAPPGAIEEQYYQVYRDLNLDMV